MKIASWNIESRLSRYKMKTKRAQPEDIVRAISFINPDIMFFPEAFSNKLDNKVKESLDELGYILVPVPYNHKDDGRVWGEFKNLHLLMIYKKEFKKDIRVNTIRLADFRNAIELVDKKNNLVVYGVHLDDRLEKVRIEMAKDLKRISSKRKEDILILGDYNAMHKEDWKSKVLRNSFVRKSLLALGRVIADKERIIARTLDMALGTALEVLTKDGGFKDIDQKMRPTTTLKMRDREFLPSFRLTQIDHILYKFNKKSIKRIGFKSYKIYQDLGSDHRAISINLK